MPTFKINDNRVKIIDDCGDSLQIESNSPCFQEACMCAMSADWNGFHELFFNNDTDNHPNECTCDGCCNDEDNTPLQESVDVMIGLLQDNLVTPKDLGICIPANVHGGHEHDLSNWNGSPIFYPTREMAIEQVSPSYGFWMYHDFGIGSPTGYRYATVPRGVGPTAPDGYDWMCVPREDQ